MSSGLVGLMAVEREALHAVPVPLTGVEARATITGRGAKVSILQNSGTAKRGP